MIEQPKWFYVASTVIATPAHGEPRQYSVTGSAIAEALGREIHYQQQKIIQMLLKDNALFGATIGPMQTRTAPGNNPHDAFEHYVNEPVHEPWGTEPPY